MPLGSYTVTWPPWRWICPATFSAGESRTSSESGLKVAPSTATRLPRNGPPPSAWRASSTIWPRWRMLIESISRRKVSAWSAPSSPARAMNARMSLGRQPPPKPIPARRNFRPIRSSYPIASASLATSPPAASHTSAIALMKEIFVARKEFAAVFTSSAVGKSVTTNGDPSATGVA
ncbi:hypothetical protein SFUMM280S_03168 [Streptomyces fumanus]